MTEGCPNAPSEERENVEASILRSRPDDRGDCLSAVSERGTGSYRHTPPRPPRPTDSDAGFGFRSYADLYNLARIQAEYDEMVGAPVDADHLADFRTGTITVLVPWPR